MKSLRGNYFLHKAQHIFLSWYSQHKTMLSCQQVTVWNHFTFVKVMKILFLETYSLCFSSKLFLINKL